MRCSSLGMYIVKQNLNANHTLKSARSHLPKPSQSEGGNLHSTIPYSGCRKWCNVEDDAPLEHELYRGAALSSPLEPATLACGGYGQVEDSLSNAQIAPNPLVHFCIVTA